MSNPFMEKYNQQNSGAGGGGGRRHDLIAEIKGFDLENKSMAVRLRDTDKAVADGYPQEFSVVISRYAPSPKRPDADFEGNVIDQRMAGMLAEGEEVVLEGVTLRQDSLGPFPVTWINSVPGGNSKKVVEGNFTASGYRKDGEFVVNSVQQWPARALTKAEFLTDDFKAAFDSAIQRAQATADAMENGTALPAVKPDVGVALRAVRNGEVIDFIPPVHYNSQARRPIAFDEVEGGIGAYEEHVQATYGEDASVEVIPVREFRVAPNHQAALARGPVGTMAKTTGKISPEGEMPPYGNNVLGVHGVLALSPGKLDKHGNRKGAENEWCVHLYANSRKGPIHEIVNDVHGNPVQLNEMLADLSYPARNAPRTEAGNNAEQGTAQEAGADAGQAAAASQADGATAAQPEADAGKAPAASQPQAASEAADDDMGNMLDEAFNQRDKANAAPSP